MSEPITFAVRETSGEETWFTIKRTTAMGRVFKCFATRKGVDKNELIFRLADGTVISDDAKPRDIGFGPGDSIGVSSWQQLQNELDATRRQYRELQSRYDRLQEQFIAANGIVDAAAVITRAAAAISKAADDAATAIENASDDSNETEKAAKRQRNE
jgi:hypothetical protein